jgi:4-amino-4-deoxy-L-arabinose transferase-like glycosyltransferase
VRLVWNLAIHRPLDFGFSDMGGYLERARTSIEHPDEPRGYFALFPWGTHWLLSLSMRAFGKDNGAAIGVLYAILGALAVAYGFALARRLTRRVWVARAVGAVLAVYYPWISLGGYTLSEPPFTLFLCATAYHGLDYADRGRARDAWLSGGMLAAGAVFRPQILAALPLYALHLLLRRQAWRRLHLRVLVPAVAAPLAVVIVVSAARMRFHTGRYGFIAGNGPLNYAFGRCHATSITARAPDRVSGYSPPSLGALAGYGASHPHSFFQLDPALDRNITVAGHIWEAEPFQALAQRCVQATGPARQARYAVAHVALLWFFDSIWPDTGQPAFRRPMEISLGVHNLLILPAALVAMGLAFRRRHARTMLLAVHVWALLVVAMVYFGDTRLRAPYDGILITLAAVTYASIPGAIRRRRSRATRAP